MSKIYAGTGRLFQEVQALPMDLEALRDIELRIKHQPHFLGEPLVVIGDANDFPQAVPPDSHHLVALDVHGQVVVVSLAAGVADQESHTNALQLAGYIESLSAEELGKITRSFVDQPQNEPLRRAWEDLGVEMDEETVELSSLIAAVFSRDAEDYTDTINAGQRILIAAEGYSSRLTGVIRWLVRNGVQIAGLRYRKYMVGGQEIYFAEQVIPSPDPAVDAVEKDGRGKTNSASETSEPWRSKGRVYHHDRLTPTAGNLLDTFIQLTHEATFALSWNHKHYFWVRGERRNFRIRTYHRDRLEIGFYNTSPAAVEEFVLAHGIQNVESYTVGGYGDSPFVAITADMHLDASWEQVFTNWLRGDAPSTITVRAPDHPQA